MDIAMLIRLYADQPRTVDDLPYTPELIGIVDLYNKVKCSIRDAITSRDAYLKLQKLRKAGKLVKKGRILVKRRKSSD